MAISDEKPAAATANLPANPLLRYLFPAGIGVGAIIAYYLYQVFTAQPEQSFGLLRAWGPWWVLSVVATYYAGSLLNRGLAQMEKMSDGMQKMAGAVAEIAAKDDRQSEQMQNLTEFNARQGEQVLQAIRDQGHQIEEILRSCQARACLTDPGTK